MFGAVDLYFSNNFVDSRLLFEEFSSLFMRCVAELCLFVSLMVAVGYAIVVL